METGKIKTLFSDMERTEALFPRTKTSAVSNDDGRGLDALLENLPYFSSVDSSEAATVPMDADTLGGLPAENYATQSFVTNKIAEAQVGGSGGDIDLSGYATKDDVNALTYIDVNAAPADLKSINSPQLNNIDLLATADDEAICPLNAITYFRAFRPTNAIGENGDWLVKVRRAHDADYSRLEMSHVTNGSSYEINKVNGTWGSWVNCTPSAFAPAGYGLGTNVKSLGNESIDNITGTGFYYGYNGLPGDWGNSFIIHLEYGSYKRQIAYSLRATTGYENYAAMREMNAGVWGEWVDISPSAFAPAGFGLGGDCQIIDSWDNAIKAGFYKSNGNTPEGYWWWGYVVPHDETNVVQTIFRESDDGKLAIRIRKSSDGVWKPWVDISPSAFAPASHSHNYVNKSGDTMTGNLEAPYIRAGNSSVTKGRVDLRVDGEGGNLNIVGPNDTYVYEIDSFNDKELRIHTATKNPTGTARFWSFRGDSGGFWCDNLEVGNPVAIQYGGTGAKDAATARANLGAAPDGFGLGVQIPPLVTSYGGDLNALTTNGRYKITSGVANSPVTYGVVDVIARDENDVTQIVYSRDSAEAPTLQRNKLFGTWEDWCFCNPPMKLGVEYRTTERWDGKVVYTKLLSLGHIGAGFSTFTDGVSFGTRVIRSAATHNGESLPVLGCGGNTSAYAKEIVVSPSAISFYGANLVTGAYLYVQAWYVKE